MEVFSERRGGGGSSQNFKPTSFRPSLATASHLYPRKKTRAHSEALWFSASRGEELKPPTTQQYKLIPCFSFFCGLKLHTFKATFPQPKPVVAQTTARRIQGSWSVLHERGSAAANLGKRHVCDRLVCFLRHGHALQGKRLTRCGEGFFAFRVKNSAACFNFLGVKLACSAATSGQTELC